MAVRRAYEGVLGNCFFAVTNLSKLNLACAVTWLALLLGSALDPKVDDDLRTAWASPARSALCRVRAGAVRGEEPSLSVSCRRVQKCRLRYQERPRLSAALLRASRRIFYIPQGVHKWGAASAAHCRSRSGSREDSEDRSRLQSSALFAR